MTTGLVQPNLTTNLSFFRGQTIRWKTTFVDFDGNVVQPPSANLVVFASTTTADDVLTTIPMQPPGVGQTAWTALLDTRGLAANRVVQWSIETPQAAPNPVAVGDGSFKLTANQANQPTF